MNSRSEELRVYGKRNERVVQFDDRQVEQRGVTSNHGWGTSTSIIIVSCDRSPSPSKFAHALRRTKL